MALNGTKIFYEYQSGENPPLVFVHGYASNHTDWQSQQDYFRSQQSVLCCDLRGHGLSHGEPDNCNIETYGNDIVALMDALDLPAAILIGHSMGCRAVLQVNLVAPQRVAGIILVDGSRIGIGKPQLAEQAGQKLIHSIGYSEMLQSMFNAMFLKTSDPAIKARLIKRALAFPEEIGANLLPRVLAWDASKMEKALAQITVPLLILQSTYLNTENVRVPLQAGENTPWFDLIRQFVPTAQFNIISGVGHFSMLEKPDVLNRAIAGFIAKVQNEDQAVKGKS